jgi:hypothetical protein
VYCIVEIVSQFTYLGSTFTPGGAFRMDFQTLSGKGLKGMYTLMSMMKTFNFDLDLKCQLCYAFVGSTMSYGVEVWVLNK